MRWSFAPFVGSRRYDEAYAGRHGEQAPPVGGDVDRWVVPVWKSALGAAELEKDHLSLLAGDRSYARSARSCSTISSGKQDGTRKVLTDYHQLPLRPIDQPRRREPPPSRQTPLRSSHLQGRLHRLLLEPTVKGSQARLLGSPGFAGDCWLEEAVSSRPSCAREQRKLDKALLQRL